MENVDVKIVSHHGLSHVPKYQTKMSAGFDIMVGGFNYEYTPSERFYEIKPGETRLIPTGLYFSVPDGYELQIRPRSGVSLKTKLRIANSPGTLDCFLEDSNILTVGGNKKIQEININETVLSVNSDCDIEKDSISAIVYLGEKEIIEIETEYGTLKITPNTEVYTKNSIKLAKDLNEDDEIILF